MGKTRGDCSRLATRSPIKSPPWQHDGKIMIKNIFDAPELRPTLGIALGGGVVKGAVHIGVLKALQEADLRPHFISGTSIGAMVGTLYAFGKQPEQIAKLAKSMNWLDITRYTFSKFGILSNKAIRKIMIEQIGDVNLEDSPIPIAVIATDIGTGERVILKNGSAADAVMASTCIPGAFVPVELGNRLLVDGGLVEHVPVSSLKLMGADYVLGIDLSGAQKLQQPTGIIDVILNAIEIAVSNQARLHGDDADLIIRLDVRQYGKPGEANVARLYERGYETARQHIEDIRNGLADKEPSPVELLAKKLTAWRSGN